MPYKEAAVDVEKGGAFIALEGTQQRCCIFHTINTQRQHQGGLSCSFFRRLLALVSMATAAAPMEKSSAVTLLIHNAERKMGGNLRFLSACARDHLPHPTLAAVNLPAGLALFIPAP